MISSRIRFIFSRIRLLQAFSMICRIGEDLSVYFSNPVGMDKGCITPRRGRIQRYFENGIPGISCWRESRAARLLERFCVYACASDTAHFSSSPTSCQLNFPLFPSIYRFLGKFFFFCDSFLV